MSEIKSEDTFWMGMVKKYWVVVLIFALAVVGLIIGFFAILLTYTANSAIGGNGTWTLAEFSMGTGILWMLLLFLWELLLGFLPFIGFCLILIVICWTVILSEEDKVAMKAREKKDKKKKRRKQGEGSGVTFLFTIAFLIVVFVQNNWLTPFGDASLTITYWIEAWLTGFIWVCIIFGIPAVIIMILYFVYRSKRKSE